MRLIDADALITEYPDDVLTHCDIEAAPTIDLESLRPQWIPVAERLPEKLVGMQSAMKEVLDYFSKFELKGGDGK